MSFEWQYGRQLKQVTNNNVTTTYTYDDSGIRQSKNAGGVETTYVTSGSTILSQKTGQNAMDFFYDDGSNLKEGDTVIVWDEIGYVGNTGNSYGVHLHLGVAKGVTGNTGAFI